MVKTAKKQKLWPLVKKELKKHFPNTKFSAKVEKYSWWSSLNIYWDWKNGPSGEEVEKIIKKYEMWYFDGMKDTYVYSNLNKDIPQVKYVFVYDNEGNF